jgi:hypothetical protein
VLIHYKQGYVQLIHVLDIPILPAEQVLVHAFPYKNSVTHAVQFVGVTEHAAQSAVIF